MPFDRKQHWERIYSEKDEQETSWFQPRPETSLGLIEATGEPLAAPLIDVGGGTSRLVDHLLEQGRQNLSVPDISGTALEHSRQRLGEQAEKVNWIEADLLEGEPGGPYRIWHDRAVFHFLTEPADRQRYLQRLTAALEPGGHLIIATFGPEGPDACSGLPVQRYSPKALAETLGGGFHAEGEPERAAPHPCGQGAIVHLLSVSIPAMISEISHCFRMERRAAARRALRSILLAALLLPTLALADTDALYRQHCAACHRPDRLGAQGPALIPENLHRLKKKKAIDVITHGRAATQMPPFGDKLKPGEIKALADYIYTPLPETPRWGMREMQANHLAPHPPGSLPDKPKFQADLDNLFVVMELGDHHFTLLDGDAFEPIGRFPTRFAVHGGPKWAEGGRYVYFLSRDGWVSKFDVYNLAWVAETRAGINARNLAVSDDGRYVMVANYLPHDLVLLDAKDLSPLRIFPARGTDGTSSRVSAVYAAPPRHSFIAALKDAPEVWEIRHADRQGRPLAPEAMQVRRLRLKGILDDFFLTQDYRTILGSTRGGGAQVIDLDSGRDIARLDLPGLPHLSSAITWERNGTRVLATPNIRKPEVAIIDTSNWKVIKRISTKGPGFFMRSHEKTPYAWTDVFFGPNRDLMHVIDKQKLEIVKTLRPEPGKTSAHVEFTKDGKYALVSIWDMDGAIVVYDANTLEEVKRIPMKKPSGKYNVHNKLTRSEGTSH